jgi:hypothetical protein
VIIFDELGMDLFPGETTAVQETLGLRNCRLRRFRFAPTAGYLVLE